MKKSNNINVEWGNRLNGILKHPLGEKSKSNIKQKDLARALGVRESNITEWKRGNWDLRLSSIYGIVEYIKKEYPESTPMITLFSDLISDEIEKIKNSIAETYEERVNKLEEELNEEKKKESVETYNELDDICNKVEDKYKRLKDKYNELSTAIKKIFVRQSPNNKKYLRDNISVRFWDSLGISD